MKTKALLRDKLLEQEERSKIESNRRCSVNIKDVSTRDVNEVVERLYKHKKVYDARKEEQKEKQHKEVIFNVRE